MTDTGFWTNWFNDPAETYLICGLIFLNLISLFFMIIQRHRFTKLERHFNQIKYTEKPLNFESASSFSSKAHPGRNTNDSTYDKNSSLKIDRAVNMLKSGVSLIEIERALDIEPNYATILKAHYNDNS